VSLRRHAGVANDLIRAGDDLLVLTSVDGMPPECCPVLHLRRIGPAPLTGVYLASLDAVLCSAEPWRTGSLAVAA
jgi:hypothetical protein